MNLLTTATTTDERDRGAKIAVLPVGSFEQHGPHLPLITDTVIACAIAKRIADENNLFLLPPITISCSHEHAAFSGTVSISATTLVAVIEDILESLERTGIEKLVVVNGHGGNYVLKNVAQQANIDRPRVIMFPASEDWAQTRVDAGLQTTNHQDMHAGELETSILLAVAPELLRVGWDAADYLADDRRELLALGVSAYSESGVIGLPSLASAAKGAAAVQRLLQAFRQL